MVMRCSRLLHVSTRLLRTRAHAFHSEALSLSEYSPQQQNSSSGKGSRNGLREELYTSTRDIHTEVESHAFIQRFFNGTLPFKAYGSYLQKLYHAYKAMEQEMDRLSTHPQVGFLAEMKNIYRAPAMEKDIRFFGHDPSKLVASPAAREYADRIRLVAETKPELLVAHAYTRYMGDLSGGVQLAQRVRDIMHLHEGHGLAFYDFGEVKPAKMKIAFKNALNSMTQTGTFKADMIEETKLSFALNEKIFEECESEVQEDFKRLQPQFEIAPRLQTLAHELYDIWDKSLELEPVDLGEYEKMEGNGLKVQNVDYTSTVFRHINIQMWQTDDGMDVIHCIMLPRLNYDLPMYGVDIILRSHPTAGFLDVSPVTSAGLPQHYRDFFADLRAKHDFTIDRPLPEWGTIFSPLMVHCRPKKDGDLDAILTMAKELMTFYVKDAQMATPTEDPVKLAQIKEGQRAYCHNHQQNKFTRRALRDMKSKKFADLYMKVVFPEP